MYRRPIWWLNQLFAIKLIFSGHLLISSICWLLIDSPSLTFWRVFISLCEQEQDTDLWPVCWDGPRCLPVLLSRHGRGPAHVPAQVRTHSHTYLHPTEKSPLKRGPNRLPLTRHSRPEMKSVSFSDVILLSLIFKNCLRWIEQFPSYLAHCFPPSLPLSLYLLFSLSFSLLLSLSQAHVVVLCLPLQSPHLHLRWAP